MGAILIFSAMGLLVIGTVLGSRRGRAVRTRITPWTGLCAVVVAIYAFIFVPIVITATVSFNSVNQSRFPPIGFSFRWWSGALTTRWLQPLGFSIELASLAAAATLVLGLPLAFGLVRYRFPGRDVLAALSLGPLVLRPW